MGKPKERGQKYKHLYFAFPRPSANYLQWVISNIMIVRHTQSLSLSLHIMVSVDKKSSLGLNGVAATGNAF